MSRQKPVTPTLHTALRYRLAIDMRKAFPTRPEIGVWEREVPRAYQGAAQATPLPTLRHMAISVASCEISLNS